MTTTYLTNVAHTREQRETRIAELQRYIKSRKDYLKGGVDASVTNWKNEIKNLRKGLLY